jgi:hypothetical protein
MGETIKIDASVVKSTLIGLISAGLVVSGYAMFELNRQNNDLRRDISDLRTRFDTYQQNHVLVQNLQKNAAPVEVKAEPAPTPAAAPQPAPAQPAATGTTLTFEMLQPGALARPPLPLSAPAGGAPKTAKNLPADSQRRVAKSNDSAIPEKTEKSDDQFVLLDKAAARDAAPSQFTLLRQ